MSEVAPDLDELAAAAAAAAELLDALDDGPELDDRELQDLDLNECNDWSAP